MRLSLLQPGIIRGNIELCRQLADLGFQHVIFNMPNVHEINPLEIIGNEVIQLWLNLKRKIREELR